MKSLALCAFFFLPVAAAFAQTPQPSSAPGEMLTLERKIDELNAKIDALSQHMLKLEQQASRPGTGGVGREEHGSGREEHSGRQEHGSGRKDHGSWPHEGPRHAFWRQISLVV